VPPATGGGDLDQARDTGQGGQQAVIWPVRYRSPAVPGRLQQITCTMHVAWDEGLTDYHFGPEHPMAPVRVELT
jgi:hypothetical protein